jgi:Crp-like helix-turn-helix domain
VPLPMRRRDIADFFGLKLETVSRALAKLELKNVIRLVPNGVFLTGLGANASGHRGKPPTTDLKIQTHELGARSRLICRIPSKQTGFLNGN